MKFLLLTIYLLFCSPLFGCLWDSDTIRNEYRKNRSVYDLIMGQFPHHGAKYYEARVKRLSNKSALTVIEQHDLGVAYVRLGEFEKAKEVFHNLHDENPDSYEVNSNLGVMYKKMGDFEKAYHFISRALEIKQEGHMGLGDWYLKRIQYELRGDVENDEPLNFLGMRYSVEYGEYSDNEPLLNGSLTVIYDGSIQVPSSELGMMLERVKLLIHNDYKFADAYLVLGDLLMRKGDKHMAVRSYMRAHKLGHAQAEIIDNKIDEIHAHWASMPDGYRGFVYDKNKEELWNDFKKELEEVNRWTLEFEKEENKLVVENSFPSFEETLNKMSMEKVQPIDSGFFENGFFTRVINRPFTFSAGLILLSILVWLRGFLKKRKEIKKVGKVCSV